MNEEALVRAILARIARSPAPGVVVGPGDDAAVVEVGAGARLVATTDALVEGVHFEAGAAGEEIGWKLVETNLSDLAAMGATPKWLLVAVEVPAGRAQDALAAIEGAASRCETRGIAIVGGNVTGGPGFALTATALGETRGRPLRRHGARPGDAIWITGGVGRSAVDRRRRPVARIEEGTAAAAWAHAAIDVSDGLALDLRRLCEASGVGAVVRLADVPEAAEIARAAKDAGLDPDETMAAGGEDYELLVAAPADAPAKGFVRIGEVIAGDDVVVRRLDGRPYDGPSGYLHRLAGAATPR